MSEIKEHYEVALPDEDIVRDGEVQAVLDLSTSEEDFFDDPKRGRGVTFRAERGTALDSNRLFRSFKDGEVFEANDGGPDPKDIARMIRTDGQARQLCSALKLPVKAAKYDIVKSEGDSGEADFIRHCLESPARMGGMTTPWKTVLAQIAQGIIMRRSHFEKVYQRIPFGEYKNKISLKKLAVRPASTCTMVADENGSFGGFKQRVLKGQEMREITYKPNKSFVYIHGADEEPILGTTAFETAYRDYQNKLKVKFFYFAFLENVAFPRTTVKYLEDDETGVALDELLAKAKKFGRMGIIGLGPNEEIEPYESQRTTRDYQLALEYLDWQMAKSCMAQFLDLGTSGERGSYALSKDKSSFFFNSIEAMLDEIASAINMYIINDLVYFNFGPEAAYPKLVFKPIQDETLTDALDIFKSIIGANQPQVTPGFLAQIMEKVALGMELDIEKVKDPDENDIQGIEDLIPAPQPRAINEPQPEMADGVAEGMKAQEDKASLEKDNARLQKKDDARRRQQ